MPYKTGAWGIQAKERCQRRSALRREYRKNNPLPKQRQIRKRNATSFIKGQTAGKNNCNWQGGITCRKYPFDFNFAFKELIRRRDSYKCQICSCPQEECHQRLDIHHKDFDKYNLNPDNLIALCRKCHARENKRRK